MTHFQPEEFRCRCRRTECDALPQVQQPLLDRLEVVRSEYGKPMIVTSGLRCPWWNALQGGKPHSSHLTGYAADIACETPQARYELLASAFRVFNRVGVGATFLHFGCDPALPPRVVWLYS